jgi:hypothetical protein
MPTSDKTSGTGWLGLVCESSNRAKKLATTIGLQVRVKSCRKSNAGGAFGVGNEVSVNAHRSLKTLSILRANWQTGAVNYDCVFTLLMTIFNRIAIYTGKQRSYPWTYNTTLPLSATGMQFAGNCDI